MEIEDPDEDLNPEELEQETEAPHEDHPSQNTEANTGTANTQTTLDEEQQVQDTQDQPAQETEVQAGSQQQEKQLPEIEKIFTHTKVNGIAWYKVKYADPSVKPRVQTVTEEHIPLLQRNCFHAEYYDNGKLKYPKNKRRRKRRD